MTELSILEAALPPVSAIFALCTPFDAEKGMAVKLSRPILEAAIVWARRSGKAWLWTSSRVQTAAGPVSPLVDGGRKIAESSNSKEYVVKLNTARITASAHISQRPVTSSSCAGCGIEVLMPILNTSCEACDPTS